MTRGAKHSDVPPPGLFRDVLLAPDRDVEARVAPVVSVREDDEREYRREVERRARQVVRLARRGVEHGSVVELRPAGLVPRELRGLRRRRREALRSERWHAARPIALPAAFDPPRVRRLDPLAGGFALADALAPRLAGSEFELETEPLPLADPERDLERVGVRDSAGTRLWVKSGRLSTWPDDRSSRVRVAFGEEGADDASADEDAHRAVARLGRLVLPETAVADGPELRAEVERLLGGPALLTQPIAYTNAPGGGARFHHDAFADDDDAQRGVLFCQVEGATVWLALSIADLAERVAEVVAWLRDGELAWWRDELGAALADLVRLTADRAATVRELALPGCGALGAVVDRGPEFTTYLADAGHARVLRAGDAIVLPNHGLGRTAMHSVFCGSPEPGAGVSQAIRRA